MQVLGIARSWRSVHPDEDTVLGDDEFLVSQKVTINLVWVKGGDCWDIDPK